MSDNEVGWISVRGNQGTPYLKEACKPYYRCATAVSVPLERKIVTGGLRGVVRLLAAEEVLEVLEGPRKDASENALRVKCRAIKDGAVGWFTLKARDGQVSAEKGSMFYLCKIPIAMTDRREIREGKSIRKLDAGELCLALDEDPVHDAAASVTRIRCRAMSDKLEGWITLKGSAGSIFAEVTSRFYIATRSTQLQHTPWEGTYSKEGSSSCAGSGSGALRLLDAEEVVEITEGPREEVQAEATRLKVRAARDGAVGWVTLDGMSARPWTP